MKTRRYAIALYDSSLQTNSVYISESKTPLEAAITVLKMKFKEDLSTGNLEEDDVEYFMEQILYCEDMPDLHAVLAGLTCICISTPMSIR